MKREYFIGIVTLLSVGGFAKTALGAYPTPCVDMTEEARRSAPVGSVCLTSRGYVFQRITDEAIGAAWVDLASGVRWMADHQEDVYSNDGGRIENGVIIGSPADQDCRDSGGRLPSREEFALAESHGFREVLLGMRKSSPWGSGSLSFWSSSFHSTDELGYTYSYVFGSYDGCSSCNARTTSVNHHTAVRCVAQVPNE